MEDRQQQGLSGRQGGVELGSLMGTFQKGLVTRRPAPSPLCPQSSPVKREWLTSEATACHLLLSLEKPSQARSPDVATQLDRPQL